MSTIKWLPLESNPDVMNRCLRSYGVPEKLGVTDILSFDDDFLSLIPQPCLAVLLLLPTSLKYGQYCDALEEKMKKKQDDYSGIFYMKQSIRNACGTIALIHAAANNEQHLDLEPDSVLKKFLDSTKDLSPEERGKVLEQNMDLTAVHEESALEGQTETPSLDEDINLHFIAFIRAGNKLVELDGRKSGPVFYGDTTEETFLQDACRICQEYMTHDFENLNFNAMAFGALF